MSGWVVLGVQSNVGWPMVETRVAFKNHNLILRPEGQQESASIAIECLPQETFEQAMLVARQFMSALAWTNGQAIREHTACGGGFPIRIGKPLGHSVSTTYFAADYLPVPADPKAQLALAVYREALSVNSLPYHPGRAGGQGRGRSWPEHLPYGVPRRRLAHVLTSLPLAAFKTLYEMEAEVRSRNDEERLAAGVLGATRL